MEEGLCVQGGVLPCGVCVFLKHNNKWAPLPPLSPLPTGHISLRVNGRDFPCGGRSSLARVSRCPGATERLTADDKCAQRGAFLSPSPPAGPSSPLPVLSLSVGTASCQPALETRPRSAADACSPGLSLGTQAWSCHPPGTKPRGQGCQGPPYQTPAASC